MVPYNVVLATIALFGGVQAAPHAPQLPLVMLTDAQSKDHGAVCLDGSNPAMYIGKANSTGMCEWRSTVTGPHGTFPSIRRRSSALSHDQYLIEGPA